MCGLVGMAGDLAFKDENTIQRLLLLDYFRGPDATGLASIRNAGENKIIKLCVNPIDLFSTVKFKEVNNGAASKALIGHNRSATTGAVNNMNAHPFEKGHIVGAHNGTLETPSFRALEDALGEKFGVDSEAIFAGFEKLGVEATIALCEEGKDSYRGAWSLVWHDSSDDSINFLRNKHRPMWTCFTKDYKKIFWASEWAMLDHAIRSSTAGYDLHKDDKGNAYFATEENIHYKYLVADIKKGSDKRLKPKVKEIKGKEPAPVRTAMGHDPFYRNTGGTGVGTTPSIRQIISTPSTTPFGKKVVTLLGDMSNPLAGYFDPIQFHSLSKGGCQWCEEEVSYAQPGLTVFEREGIVMCPKCSGRDMSSTQLPDTRIYVTPAEFLKVV